MRYTLAVFTGFLHLSCARLLNAPVLPVTCDIICAGGDMWFYHGFCTSCLCLYLSSRLLPCIHAFIYSPIRYSELTVRVNPIAPPQQHRAPASCAPSCYKRKTLPCSLSLIPILHPPFPCTTRNAPLPPFPCTTCNAPHPPLPSHAPHPSLPCMLHAPLPSHAPPSQCSPSFPCTTLLMLHTPPMHAPHPSHAPPSPCSPLSHAPPYQKQMKNKMKEKEKKKRPYAPPSPCSPPLLCSTLPILPTPPGLPCSTLPKTK